VDITRRKGVYREGKVASSSIEGNSALPFGWKLPIKKNGVAVATYDFTHLSSRPKLARMFMAAIDGLSSRTEEITLETYRRNLVPFWDFLRDMESQGMPIDEPRQIDSQVVKKYVAWLKRNKKWSIGTQHKAYTTFKVLMRWLIRYHNNVLADIDFPINPFAQKNRQSSHREAYSSHVTEQIEKAVMADIEEIKKKVETPYVKTGKGIDPRGHRASEGRWKDFDNVVWYFENVLDCQYRKHEWLMSNGHSSFSHCGHLYGGLDNVWTSLGVWSGSSKEMLVPFFLLFAYLSGANLTPMFTMRRDCIKQHPSLDRKCIVLQKTKSGNASYKINHSGYCVNIVKRVLEITKDLALEADDNVKNYLWLYRPKCSAGIAYIGMSNRNDLGCFLKAFVKKHNIRDENGVLVKLNIARLRPTFASKMFVKTKGDIVKIQKLLNHEWISTTQGYVSSAGMDHMREDAASDLANHEKKLRAQVAVGDVASELGISKEETVKVLSGEYDTYLGKCRDLFDSPLQGEKKGRACTRFHNCLQCPSCVITSFDLHRILSYYNHINRLRKFMPSKLFNETYGWVIKAIDEACGRFKPSTVEEAKRKALADPFPAWDIKLELAEFLEKRQEGNDNQRNGVL